MRPRVICWVAAGAIVAGVAAGCSRRDAHGTATTPPTLWQDEFDGPQGASPDPGNWSAETGGSGWGNQQLQYYTSSAATLDGDGHLVITAEPAPSGLSCWYGPCSFVSGRITTYRRFAQRYGHFEVRMKLPAGTATWPAVWMMGTDRYSVGWPESGELDIAEHVGRDGDVVSGAAHGPGFSGGAAITGDTHVTSGDFHTYSLDWTPDEITWRIDGTQFHHVTAPDVPDWVFDKEFFVIIDLAVGGEHAGDPGPGDDAPQTLVVDYIRVTSDALPRRLNRAAPRRTTALRTRS